MYDLRLLLNFKLDLHPSKSKIVIRKSKIITTTNMDILSPLNISRKQVPMFLRCCGFCFR